MYFLKIFLKAFLLCVAFGCVCSARSTDKTLMREEDERHLTKLYDTNHQGHAHNKAKRQSADIKTIEYMARWALERASQGCDEIGCGMIDLEASGKKKRNNADLKEQILLPLLIKSHEE